MNTTAWSSHHYFRSNPMFTTVRRGGTATLGFVFAGTQYPLVAEFSQHRRQYGDLVTFRVASRTRKGSLTFCADLGSTP